MQAVRGFLLFTASCANCPWRDCPATGDRGDIGGHISTEPRINDRIRVPEVRLVGPSGEQVGIVSITDALRLAQEADLDLVEVAPTARPPVCKLMDFGKFKYESALKARESRKNQAQTVIKEIKIRPKIDPHDYGTKKGHVERFLRQGDKVKVTIMFRGREQSRPELGYKLLQRLAGDVEELGFVESQPKQDGRNMIMVIGPHRKKADAKAVRAPERASARASAPTASQDRAAAPAAPRTTEPATPRTTEPATPRTTEPATPRTTEPATPRTAAPARPASRPASASQGTGGTGSASPRPEPPRPSPTGSQRPAGGSGGQAAPRPGPPRPGPGTAGPRPGPSGGAAGSSAGAARPSAPRPGPSGGAAGPSGGAAATSGNGPRPAAPRPSAPRSPAAKPGDPRPVPTPRAKATEPSSAEQRAAGAEAGG
jgi:translation initiation factor IF-3